MNEALFRAPSSRLAEGIVTHIRRTAVDVALARAQHAAYADALAACGWMIARSGRSRTARTRSSSKMR